MTGTFICECGEIHRDILNHKCKKMTENQDFNLSEKIISQHINYVGGLKWKKVLFPHDVREFIRRLKEEAIKMRWGSYYVDKIDALIGEDLK